MLPRPYDYYRLRAVTQNDPLVDGIAMDWAGGTLGVFAHPARFTVSALLRTTYLASACKTCLDVRGTLAAWLRSWSIDMKRHVLDLHELQLGIGVLCVLLAVFSVSSESSYNGMADGEMHSMGIAWGLLVMASITVFAGGLFLVRRA